LTHNKTIGIHKEDVATFRGKRMEHFSPTFCVFPIVYPHFVFGTLGSGRCDRRCLEGGLPILTPYAPNIQFKFA